MLRACKIGLSTRACEVEGENGEEEELSNMVLVSYMREIYRKEVNIMKQRT